MKKRIFSFALCLLATSFIFSSCNKNADNNDTPTAVPEPTGLEDLVGSKDDINNWIYIDHSTHVMMREVHIDSGLGGEPAVIAHMTDLHFNYCNQQDFEESNPSIMSTYLNREWYRGGKSVNKAINGLEKAAKEADQLVITGDVLDYLSWGAIELTYKFIWDKYPDTLITLGNHEATRVCEGELDDPTTLESRLEILKENWKHDIFYTSKIIKDKVMVIQMDNASDNTVPGRFWECQIEPLKKDLALAREKGYVVLLFYHIPIATNNEEQGVVKPIRGEEGECYFANYGSSHNADEYSSEVYNLIVNNADVIKGTFCGHLHNDYYTEIIAKNSDGTDAIIPQYVSHGMIYDGGHMIWITVK